MRLPLVTFWTLVLLANDLNPAVAQSTIHSEFEPVVTFLSDRTGYHVIYAITPDGTGVRPIFGGPIKDVPNFNKDVTLVRQPLSIRQSPNGKYFASCAFDTGSPYKKYNGVRRPMLWVGELQGSWTRVVTPDCTQGFAWSPESTKIAFSIHARDHNKGNFQPHPDTTEICVCGIDGSTMECVLELGGNWYVQDWSPDGERLLLLERPNVMSEKDKLFEFRMVDSANARTKAGGDWGRGTEWPAKHAAVYLDEVPDHFHGLENRNARYSRDGKELAILGYTFGPMIAGGFRSLEGGPRGAIGILNLPDERFKTIASYKGQFDGQICWSNDASEILFAARLPKDKDDKDTFTAKTNPELSIWAIDRDGENARLITTGWNPDCSRVADR